jgi:hypothetical protein
MVPSIKDIQQPVPSAPSRIVAITIVVVIVSSIPSVAFAVRSLKDLVEFTSIQPNAAALRTIVDLNAVALSHHQILGNADWTLHRSY